MLFHVCGAHRWFYAIAILQIADGKLIGEVAAYGLLRRRQDETVSTWVHCYLKEGLPGLAIQPGRGRVRGKRLVSVRRETLEDT